MDGLDLSGFLRSDRPPIELAEYSKTYRRTRIAVSVLIALITAVLNQRFDHRPYVMTGIAIGCLLIISHAWVR